MFIANLVTDEGQEIAWGLLGAGVGLAFPEPHEFGVGVTGYLNKTVDLSGKERGVGAGWPPTMAAPERLYVSLLIIT